MVYGKLFSITQKESRKARATRRPNTNIINTSQVLQSKSLAITKWLMILIALDRLARPISKAT